LVAGATGWRSWNIQAKWCYGWKRESRRSSYLDHAEAEKEATPQ